MRIDAHQHFWQPARGDYGWLTPELAPLYRDFGPEDLAPLMAGSGIDGTILVQAAPTTAETEYMLDLARQTPFVKGVVGWVNFEAADVAETIARLAADPLIVGLRPMIQDIADDDWMLRPDLTPAYRAMIDHDLTFDALVLPRHLTRLSRLLARHPDLRTVIDHGAKPEIATGEIVDWAADMAALAAKTSAFCKLSGLATEAGDGWQPQALRPYVETLLDLFGPDRLIWGSDWPVATLAVGYGAWHDLAEEMIGGTPEQAAAIFGGNAIRAYRL
ncbi:amidohydrolase family protein [Algicella marina]|uniref:Amidohydrolase family protein n=1 Tax=Algicella marina TaxID=2683284 RepID=A0A6P1SXE6_9RHOB|nr:amidohydrolase family protein [Algicella marina]QHQ35128.1 amidohydrolase family protein [Algicella marina]